MTQDIAADRLEAVVDVVPFVVVDGAVWVDHGDVVPVGVDVAAEDAEAVQDVEDGEADDVVVHVVF